MREQLGAQLILGILSRRLAPGERLPSVRQLGRQLKLHPNTVSTTYHDLANRGWLKNRPGSGVFVNKVSLPESKDSIDTFVATCIEDGLARGFSLEALQFAFSRTASESRPRDYLVIDPDVELARIMAVEIGEVLARELPFCGLVEASRKIGPSTCVLANQVHMTEIVSALGVQDSRAIQLKSMQDLLAGHQRPKSVPLVAIVSHSESILRWAGTLLSSLGFSPDAVLLRNPRSAGWLDGLRACQIVATDVVASKNVPKRLRATIFKIVSEEFLSRFAEL